MTSSTCMAQTSFKHKTTIRLSSEQLVFFSDRCIQASKFIRALIDGSEEFKAWKDGREY